MMSYVFWALLLIGTFLLIGTLIGEILTEIGPFAEYADVVRGS